MSAFEEALVQVGATLLIAAILFGMLMAFFGRR